MTNYGAFTAATATNQSTLTMADIIKAVSEAKDKINALQKVADTNWILISPTGEVNKGTVQELIGELMKYHPLFKDTFQPYQRSP